MSLSTDYKDDVFTGNRKYSMTDNGDGTYSFTDETEYTQEGDSYGAAEINEVNDIVNGLSDYSFRSDADAETTIDDADYFPYYDSSAGSIVKSLWSNIKTVLANTFAIKVHNGTTASTYGAGNASYFGHVKLSDTYTSSGGGASSSVGASSAAVYNAYTKLNNQLTANSNEIYMDYKNGKYGYNTSSSRGADTFHPFNNISSRATVLSKQSFDDEGNWSFSYTVSSTAAYEIIVFASSTYMAGSYINSPSGFSSTIINTTGGNGQATSRVFIGEASSGSTLSISGYMDTSSNRCVYFYLIKLT